MGGWSGPRVCARPGLAGERPIVTGTPITPDLQTWIRNASLDPDWLRAGTDVVGAGTFNGAFTLSGNIVPEPGTFLTFGFGALGAFVVLRRRR